MADKEKIAKSAANTWCRCFKCNGVINSTHEKCEKDKLLTCHKWYDGYRTALLAISDYEQQMMTKAIDARCFGFQGAALFSFRLPADKYLVGSEVKVIIIKED